MLRPPHSADLQTNTRTSQSCCEAMLSRSHLEEASQQQRYSAEQRCPAPTRLRLHSCNQYVGLRHELGTYGPGKAVTLAITSTAYTGVLSMQTHFRTPVMAALSVLLPEAWARTRATVSALLLCTTCSSTHCSEWLSLFQVPVSGDIRQ